MDLLEALRIGRSAEETSNILDLIRRTKTSSATRRTKTSSTTRRVNKPGTQKRRKARKARTAARRHNRKR